MGQMPFSKKYTHLGHTVRERIPQRMSTHVGQMLTECDRICGTHGEIYLSRIMDRIVEGLENVP